MCANNLRLLASCLMVILMNSSDAAAGFVHWFNSSMEDDWWNAVGEVTTIDFTGFENFEVLSDQYADLGVTFSSPSNGIVTFFETGLFVNDGWGLRGFNGAWIEFDQPMNWIAADHPGTLGFALYHGDQLVHEIGPFGQSGTGHFAGLISPVPFDRVFLWKSPSGPTQEYVVFVDDLHFGAIPAPGALGVFALGLLCASSRRRYREAGRWRSGMISLT